MKDERKPTLDEITARFAIIASIAAENDGELDGEALDDLDACEAALEDKLDACAWVLGQLEAAESDSRLKAQTWTAHAGRVKRNAEGLKEKMLYTLEGIGATKIETRNHIVGTAKKPPSIEIEDEALILANEPDLFIEQQPKLDKREALQRLKAGEEIEGAKLITGQKRLTIK